jgi:hypothetical protein
MPSLDVERLLRVIRSAKEEKIRDRRRYSMLGDLTQIHLALGAEEMCDALERRVLGCLEQESYHAQQRELQRRQRVLRDRQRQLHRQPDRGNGGDERTSPPPDPDSLRRRRTPPRG